MDQVKAEQNPALGQFVIVETDRGVEVWPNTVGSFLTAIFTFRSDADAFVSYASKSDAGRIQNAALEVARAFPDLNYSNQPINPGGELVQRIARIISVDFPVIPEREAEIQSER